MRRIATVTQRVPDSASARSISSNVAYLPVPSTIRDPNSRPPIRSASVIARLLPAADHRHDLDAIALGERRRRVLRPRDDLAVPLDGDAPPVDAERGDELLDRRSVLDLARLTVDDELHVRVSCRRTRAGRVVLSARDPIRRAGNEGCDG